MTSTELIEVCIEVLKAEDMRPIAIAVPLCQVGLAEPDYCVAIIYGPGEGESRIVSVDEEGINDYGSSDLIVYQWGIFLLMATIGANVNDFDITKHVKQAL